MVRWTISAMIGVAFMGSGLITPLYTFYQKAFHFSEVTLTFVYSAYVLGNLIAMLFFARTSDEIGRRIVGLISVAAGIVSALLFLFAEGTVWLIAARIFSGIAVGLASGTGTAWLIDLIGDPRRAALFSAAANAFGFALGPLAAGLLAQYAADPTVTPFYAYLPLLAAVGALVAFTRETVDAKGRRLNWSSLRPRVGVPKEIAAQFTAPAITCFGTFALVGFYGALIPTILKETLHVSAPAVGGVVVFEIAFVAGIVTLAAREVESRMAMLSALGTLFPCIALLLWAQSAASMPLLLVATAAGGICWGLGIRGSLQVVNEIAPQERRAEIASSYYIAGFIGNSIPVISVGLITALSTSMVASLSFGCTIAAFAVAAIVFGLRNAPARA